MKKIIAVFCLGLSTMSLFGQESADTLMPNEITAETYAPFYLGGGIGLNDLGIVGVVGQLPVTSKFGVYAGLGTGSWGGKFSLGGTYFIKTPQAGPSLSLGFARASGAEGVELPNMPADPIYYGGIVGNETKADFIVDLKPVNTVTVKYSYAWAMGMRKRTKFVFDIGYAIPLSDGNYTAKYVPKKGDEPITIYGLDGGVLGVVNENGEIVPVDCEMTDASKASMKMLEPGGIILGAKFLFGIGN